MNEMPPHDFEVERSLLSVAMNYPDKGLDRVISAVKTEWFYKEAFAAIFDGIVEMRNKSEPIDSITLSNHLASHRLLTKAGGRVGISEIATVQAMPHHVDTLSKSLEELSLRRLIKAVGTGLSAKASDMGADIGKVKTEALQALSEATMGNNEEPSLEDEAMSLFEASCLARNNKGITGIPSGFTDLDQLTGGFTQGQLILIAARPSVGKTALAMKIAMETRCMIFSMEMTRRDLLARWTAIIGQLDLLNMRLGRLSDEDWSTYQVALDEASKIEASIMDKPSLTIADMMARTRQAIRDEGIKLVVVDYLQLITATAKSRREEVGQVSRGLKQMAMEFKIPVLALSQLTRANEQRGISDVAKRPRLSDLRETGDLEQDADAVLFLHPNSKHKDRLTLIIAKQRNGPIADVQLRWNGPSARFDNWIV
jgi:replicative DNA helicase